MTGGETAVAASRMEVKGVVNKKELSGPQKPDAKAYQEKLATANAAIEEMKEKLKEVREKINSASGGRQELIKKKQELRDHMDEIQKQIESLEAERKTILGTIDEQRQSGQKIKNDLTAMKKTMGFKSEDQINQKISELENSMMTSTLALKEEKRMLQQIQQLKSSKKLVEKYNNMEANAQSIDTSTIVGQRARLEQINEELQVLRNRKRTENEKFRELLNEQQTHSAPLKELWEERDRYRRAYDELLAKRRQHHDAYNAAMRQWQTHQNIVRQARSERIKEEKMRRLAEQQKAVLERQLEQMDVLPFEKELLLFKQTIAYVNKLTEDRDAKVVGQENQESSAQWAVNAFEGGETLVPKSMRPEEFVFTPKKNSSAKKNQQNHQRSKSAKPHIYKHDIGTLYYFEQCKVPAPVTEDDLEDCLSKLLVEYKVYQKQQEEEIEKHKEKRLELESQLQALDLTGKKLDKINEFLIEDPTGEASATPSEA